MRFAPNPRDYDCDGDYEDAMNRYLDYQEYIQDVKVDEAWEIEKERRMMEKSDV